MYYSDEVVEEVRMRNDIVDVISNYVSLKHKGNSYTCCCPFHNEKTPSFHVSRDKQMYYCFGCGKGGNIYTFVMEMENFSFPEAVRYLAERAGVDLPTQSMSQEERKKADKRERIKEMNKLAAVYFYSLLKSKHGEKALVYLKDRGLSEETIRNFGLGYSDIYSDDLYKYIKSKGYNDEEIRDSGLVRFSEKDGITDRFWNRVMFPIMDVNSKVIGFGGRVLGDGLPKYVNTSDTLLFDKSRNIYGIHIAKKSKRRGLIFCEGYMDVISMHQAGFDNAVASLGTALTPGQVTLAKRFADKMYLSYDSDEAGTKAAVRAVGIMRSFGLPCRVISLKPYKDPDELIKNCGAQEMENRIENAVSGLMFVIGVISGKYNQSDPEERTQFQREAAAELARIEDPLERQNYIDSVAREYSMDGKALKEMVDRIGVEISKGTVRMEEVPMQRTERRAPEEEKAIRESKGERLLISWLINEERLFKAIDGIISEEDFIDPVYKSIAHELFAQYEKDGKVMPASIINKFQSVEEHEVASSIMQEHFEFELSDDAEKESVINDIVKGIKRKNINEKLKNAGLADIAKLNKEKQDIEKINIKF